MNKQNWIGVFTIIVILLACTQNNLESLPPYLKARIEAQKSIIILKNQGDLLPLLHLETKKIAFLNIGITHSNFLSDRLKKYTHIEQIDSKLINSDEIETSIKNINTLIIGFNASSLSLSANNYKIFNTIVHKYGDSKKIILILFDKNENINNIVGLEKIQSIVLAQNENKINQELSAEIIFGGSTCTAKLKDDLNTKYLKGFGIELNEKIRFAYTEPEMSGLDSKILNHKIDSIANFAIEQGAFPGCQVLVAKNMNVVFHKMYGYQTYENSQKVKSTDIYDLASVTKIAASTIALMKLYEAGAFQLDDAFSNTWTDWKDSDKDTLTWRQLLTHQARLKAWLPFWTDMVDKKGNYKSDYLSKDSTSFFSVKIKDSLYLRNNYKQEIYQQIKESKLSDSEKYLYSCLSFYLYPQIVEDFSKLKFENYLNQTFYDKLGAENIKFNAYNHFPINRIIPTENETYFRKMQIRGSVHDEGASVMGGISGNAGLFSDANDMAKLMQMLCNYGTYGGEQFFKPETVRQFTSIQFPKNQNRRGLGFDKPSIGNDTIKFPNAYPAPSTSASSFGHSGFTGTFVWADPENNIVFIFLSNRVFPTRENSKIYQFNIRPALHQAIYDAIQR